MGSKQSLLPWIMEQLDGLPYGSALDAFSGSACVAHAMKSRGKRVVANDFLQFAFHLAKATIENNREHLEPADMAVLLRANRRAHTFIRDAFRGLYFSDEDNAFLDETYANTLKLACQHKRSLALAALCRACMKKRPRGIFTFTGRKSWDGRRDLRLSMREQFERAVEALNGAIFDNGQANRALCLDVFEIPFQNVDLVYIDTPYLGPHSDADYTRRYHFVEGLCSYWDGAEIQHHTKTKKIRSYKTAFASVRTAAESFRRLFGKFSEVPTLAVSYSSNGIPSRDDMVKLLRSTGRRVRVKTLPHRYCFGNHGHKVGDNNNDVDEYLFIAQ